MNLTSSDLELVKDKSDQLIGLRFEGINVSRGTKIRSAAIQFTTDEVSKDPTELVLQVVDAANTPKFVDEKHHLSSQKLLADKILWKPERWNKADESGAAQRTPDLAALIQQLINRPDWTSGHAVTFLISGKGKRVAQAGGRNSQGPRLIIDADGELSQPTVDSHAHTVRLQFSEPTTASVGDRVFHVSLQGQRVVSNLDVVQQTGGAQRTMVREFQNVQIGNELTIDLTPVHGQTILSGVEILREGD